MRTNVPTGSQQDEPNNRFSKICEGALSQYKNKYICIIYYIFHGFVIWNLLSLQCLWYWNKCLQNWGDNTDVSQAVIGYVWLSFDLLLICWFGTQLTQHVRQNALLLFLLTLLTHYFRNGYRASNKLRN